MRNMRKTLIVILLFAAVTVFAVLLIDRISTKSKASEAEMVKDAVHKAVLTCYAVEGEYPASLQYLRENYGLSYDEDSYIIHYDRGEMENVFPTVVVLEMGRGAV